MQPTIPQTDITSANSYSEIKVDANTIGSINYTWAKHSNVMKSPAFVELTSEPASPTTFNFFSLLKKRFQNVSYRENTVTNELATLAQVYKDILVINEPHQVVKQIRKQHISIPLIADHIQNAKKYMSVEKAVLRVLSDRLADDNSIFISFSLATESKSSSQQFRNYVTEYLQSIELNKSKIHVSIA